MATLIAFAILALLAGGCYFIYARSTSSSADATDEKDLQRFMVANRELHLERIDHAVWDRAMNIAHGDEGVARARYIQLRVQQMKDESAAAEAAQ